jgi:hypothetical protein
MKTLREYLDQLDEISRRDFLKGAGATAGLAAVGQPTDAKGQVFFTVPGVFNVDSDPPLPRKIKGAWNYFKKDSLTQDDIQTISRLVRLMYIAKMSGDDYRDSQGGRLLSGGVPSKIYQDAYELLVFINDSFTNLPIGNVLNTVKKQFEDMQRNDPAQFKKWQEFYFKNWMETIVAGNLLKQALTK